MRVFMCEYVTGGGMSGEALPSSLARDGAMMRDALARDLLDIAGVELITTRDERAAPPPTGARSVVIEVGAEPWSLWERLAASADVCWVIAPETEWALARLTTLARAGGATVVGPDDDTIRIASSKTLTAERLIANGVATPPVRRPVEAPRGAPGPFVTKPDDGAGCDDTLFWAEMPPETMLPRSHIVQPFVRGEAASLTVLHAAGRTELLSANRQHVTVDDGVFTFRGVSVAALADTDGALRRLAEAVTTALPGLAGIFGIDIVLTSSGPVVIEINPRITSAYAGLREAIGRNPVSLVPPFDRAETETVRPRRLAQFAS